MSRRPLTLLSALLAPALAAAQLPDGLRAALSTLNPGVPPGWAYTATTIRGGERATEAFDPELPPQERWTLLSLNGRPATPDEARRHRSYRVTTSTSTIRATFNRGDIDPGSARLLREDATHAEYRFGFRKDIDDALLSHLEIDVLFRKSPGGIEKITLRLTEPFSPVLGMKMRELTVATVLDAAAPGEPPLPRSTHSHFEGRLLLFKSVTEDVRVEYSGYRRSKGATAARQ